MQLDIEVAVGIYGEIMDSILESGTTFFNGGDYCGGFLQFDI